VCAAGAQAPAPAKPTVPAPAAPAPTLQAGPVYTAAHPSGTAAPPAYPHIDVVLRTAGTTAAPAPADLRLLEDGTVTGSALSVRSFDATGYPIQAVTAIDASGSMKGRPLAILRDSLYRFASDARPQDKVGILSFADDTRWEVPFNADRGRLREALQKIVNRGSQTHLYDALLDALHSFDPAIVRRELIVISDGHDEGSTHSIDDVVVLARQLHIPIDAIGVTQSSPQYLSFLQQLSSSTGGQYRQARSDAELQALVGNGISGIKAQPVAAFQVQRLPADGREHPIAVRWLSAGVTAPATLRTIGGGAAAPVAWWRQRDNQIALAIAVLALLVLVAWLLLHGRREPEEEDLPAARAPAPPVLAEEAPAAPQRAQFASAPEPLPIPAQRPVFPSGAMPAPRPPVREAKTQIVAFFDRRPDGAFACIEFVAGPRSGDHVTISADQLSIGALPDNDLVIAADPAISGHHARLLLDHRIWMVEDARSTNGTWVNGERLGAGQTAAAGVAAPRRSLSPGDEVRMGQTVFRVARPHERSQDASHARNGDAGS